MASGKGRADLPAVILVRPRNPNNIGAAARAMANFGFRDLRVVAPHPPVWREARSAVGAERLLKRARVFASLEEALRERRMVYATSAMKGRRARLPVLDPAGCALGGKDALVFGPEKTGLSSEDLSLCRAIVRIPTVPGCPSMNLAQAVALVCYVFSRRRTASRASPPGVDGATRARLAVLWAGVLGRAGYRRAWSDARRLRRVREALEAPSLGPREAALLFEAGRVLIRLGETPGPDS